MYEEVSVFSYVTRNSIEKSITVVVKIDDTYVGFFTIDIDNDLFITYEENNKYDKELVVDVIKNYILKDVIYENSKYISSKKDSYINIRPDAYRNLKQFINDYYINLIPWGNFDINNTDFTCIYISNQNE